MSFHRPLLLVSSSLINRLDNQGRKRLLVRLYSFARDTTNSSGRSLSFFYEADCRQQYSRRSTNRHERQPCLGTLRWFSTDKKNKPSDDDQQLQEEAENSTTTTSTEERKRSQFWSNWIHELRSPPNIITTTRILCTPILSYWIVTGHHKLALGGCILAAASDWIDGYLAKNHGMATVLGAYLDPMADKIFINVLSVSLWYTNILPGPLVALWLARDVLLIGGAASFVRSQSQDGFHAFDPTVTPLKVNPTYVSKANTALQFITVGIGIAYPLYNIPPEVLSGFCYLTGFTTIASGFSYLDYSAFSDSGNKFEGNEKKDAPNNDEKK